eukprot:15434184-Alexandrium_andersonii.AAC.1
MGESGLQQHPPIQLRSWIGVECRSTSQANQPVPATTRGLLLARLRCVSPSGLRNGRHHTATQANAMPMPRP